jgi:hypothetical protein
MNEQADQKTSNAVCEGSDVSRNFVFATLPGCGGSGPCSCPWMRLNLGFQLQDTSFVFSTKICMQ